MTKILVTGATGFLGKTLCATLIKEGFHVKGTYRKTYPENEALKLVEWIQISDLLPKEIWKDAIIDCDIIIHAAGRVHQMECNEKNNNAFIKDNLWGTTALLEAIIQNKNVKQFIFISTLLVYGKSQAMPLNINKECIPDTPYGKSKLAAEEIIQSSLKNTSINWTIFRPSVMYNNCGAFKNTGNIASLEKYIKKGIPLPVKNLKNKRSFLSVENMNKFIISSILNKNAKNKIYNVSDTTPISTEKLVIYIGNLLNAKPRLVWVPFFMQYIFAVLGDFIQKFGINLPWNTDVLAKISSDFWIKPDSIPKD